MSQVNNHSVAQPIVVDVLAPAILLGRGGSGTRLLSALAAQSGAFLGNDLNVSGDSVEWVADIYELAREACASDIAPGSERDAYWRQALQQRATDILGKAALPAGAKWGWKLPETILALPQILRAFPRARVIHLTRHPFTSSLRRTHMTSRNDNPIGASVLSSAYRAAGRAPEAILADEPYLHNAYTWAYQVGGACRALDAFCQDDRVLRLRYEDLCANPAQARGEIAAFLGIQTASGCDAALIDWRRTDDVDPGDARLDQIWSICGDVARSIGYSRTDFAPAPRQAP